jgi:hypothetical protein
LVGIALELLILAVIYALIITLLVLLLRRLGAPPSTAIILGFLIFGLLSALLVAWVWPTESSIYGNIFAVLAGDSIYTLAIEHLGDSHSPNAHETIPWLLRIPQVYVVASLGLSGAVGIPAQWMHYRRSNRQARQQ